PKLYILNGTTYIEVPSTWSYDETNKQWTGKQMNPLPQPPSQLKPVELFVRWSVKVEKPTTEKPTTSTGLTVKFIPDITNSISMEIKPYVDELDPDKKLPDLF
ncbi:MAG: hypothetical protein ACRCZG_04630, partial [Culicoidibacterales bacterium]